MKYTVEELAKSVEGKVVGDGSVEIRKPVVSIKRHRRQFHLP